jgi:hypothetical protein
VDATRERMSSERSQLRRPVVMTSAGESCADTTMPDDLDIAVRLGFMVLPRPTPEGVTLTGRILRFDPSLAPRRRAALVRLLLAQAYDDAVAELTRQ